MTLFLSWMAVSLLAVALFSVIVTGRRRNQRRELLRKINATFGEKRWELANEAARRVRRSE